MRVSALIIFALLTSASIARMDAASEITPLRVGDAFPHLEGEFLTGRLAVLPDASIGKMTLIMMGFTYASRFPVESWGDWFRMTAGTRSDVTFFEVPMISGLAKLGRWFIDSGMRKGTPEALHDNVITVYSKAGDWKKRLGVSPANEDYAFLVLVDEAGIVRWLYRGEFDETAAGDLKSLLASRRIDQS